MGRKTAWIVGLSSTSVLAYLIWRKWVGAADAAVVRAANDRADRAVTEASEESFPASDAPSYTPMVGSKVH